MSFELPDMGTSPNAMMDWCLDMAKEGDILLPGVSSMTGVSVEDFHAGLNTANVDHMSQSEGRFDLHGSMGIFVTTDTSAGSQRHEAQDSGHVREFDFDITVKYGDELRASTEIY
jgi:hypothetical protein